MDEFYGPWCGRKLDPYRTQMLGDSSATKQSKIIPEHIAHQKYTKMANLNTQYLDMVRTNTQKRRSAISTAMGSGEVQRNETQFTSIEDEEQGSRDENYQLKNSHN